jgi:hypothetical protein
VKKTVRGFLVLWLAIGLARASTIESVGGRLERNAADEVVLTLDLPASRLAALADKEGEALDRMALAELIRERMHYLLRLRVGNQEVAPTAVIVAMPPANAALQEFVPLFAVWTGVGSGRMEVITQADSPSYRVALVVENKVPLAPQASMPDRGSESMRLAVPRDIGSSRPWLWVSGVAVVVGLSALVFITARMRRAQGVAR